MLLLPVQKPRTLHNIVKETKAKILKLQKNLMAAGQDYQPVQQRKKAQLNPDSEYMELLGLPPYPLHLEPPGVSEDLLIVSGVSPGQIHHVAGFIHACSHLQTEFSILLHDLALSKKDKIVLDQVCNSSLCQVSQFNFVTWPNHVKDLRLQAYRPILIQLGLRESRLVLWMDIDTRIVNTNIKMLMDKVKNSYILSWPEERLRKDGVGAGGATPTTALTHPRMFEYFPQTQKEDYEFQHMVTASCLLLYLGHQQPNGLPQDSAKMNANTTWSATPPLITSLMVPWLKCILIEDCVNPIGAQSTGCRFDKKPKYRYSGCHSYDVSALNIVLGEMFSFRESLYMSNSTFFKRVNPTMEQSSTTNIPLNISEYGLT